VNKQVSHIGIAALVLLSSLVIATTYWQTWANAGLANRQDNDIRLVAQFTIKRGKIYASDGRTVLATNVTRNRAGQTLYFRRYPTGPIFSDVVGYSTQTRNRTGLEQSYNDYLTGSNANLDTVFRSALDKLKGTTVTGNDLVLTINPAAQALARRLLRGKCGAVVALEPSTGRVLVMATNPTYNANLIEKRFGVATRTNLPCGAPLLNRGTVGKYPPGSTFKMVTAAAALDTKRFTPDSPFYDPGYCEEYGKQVRNAGNPEAPETFGHVNLTLGFQHSINSVFCNIGKALGAGVVLDYAKRFGFYSLPPLELPESERVASGLYNRGRLFDPKHPDTQVDPGRLAFGQERLAVTPLQMAMVAAAIGNHGAEMRPQIVERIVSPGGKTITHLQPDQLGRPIKRQTADELTRMMELVVTGGTISAPIAKQVMEALLR
jgi:peptidoglycan glycosyltransferase